MTRRRERLQTEDLLDARDAISLLSRESAPKRRTEKGGPAKDLTSVEVIS